MQALAAAAKRLRESARRTSFASKVGAGLLTWLALVRFLRWRRALHLASLDPVKNAWEIVWLSGARKIHIAVG